VYPERGSNDPGTRCTTPFFVAAENSQRTRIPGLAAAVWSLQYNLGPGHARRFLDAYGVPPTTDDEIETLRRSYETMP
jgi:hypothetical protein